ncbi:MAG: phenylalanine--tRNA ligase subunit beta [Armatimonadetes bacterium]|nr:phenylalanine--tRNA ligase subunit beta [Armatimonadota bacterium]
MRVPLSWLKEYVEIDLADEKLVELFNGFGLSIDEIIKLNSKASGIAAGEIINLQAHPNADRLRIAQVNIGKEILPIITAASNVKIGDKIPLAKEGAILADGTLMKKANLRGIDSLGMMCSARELGLNIKDLPQEEREGVMLLPSDTHIGEDIAKLFLLNDTILNFEIFANRSDCLSIFGIAKEVSVILNQELKIPKMKLEALKSVHESDELIKVEIENFEDCPCYIARVIKNIEIKPSPLWLRARLINAGIRSVNNLVDLTNYVMIETGQPLHVFDYDKIADKKIIVRKAKEGEEILAITGESHKLDSGVLVIADAKTPIAIAGIMGGKDTEISLKTKNILLESALFNSSLIRRNSLKLGIRSESSRRFEKGLNYWSVERGSFRFVELLENKIGFEVIGEKIQVSSIPPKPLRINFRISQIDRILGIKLKPEEVENKLQKMGFEMKRESEDNYLVKVPSSRGDIKEEIDLIEEIARLNNYESIPFSLPKGKTLLGKNNPLASFENKTKEILARLGLSEVISYSLTSKENLEKFNLGFDHLIKVLNPLSLEQEFLRNSPIIQLLQIISYNLNLNNIDISIFEISKIYQKFFQESKVLTLALSGNFQGNLTDFYTLKGILEVLFRELNLKAEFSKINSLFLHPGQSAEIKKENEVLGFCGKVLPKIKENFGIFEDIFIAEIDLKLLFKLIKPKVFSLISKYPAVMRDIALVVPQELPSLRVEELILSEDSFILKEARCFDQYFGGQIPEGYKSLAFSLIYQADDHTLREEEVDLLNSKILVKLKEKLGAVLRQ